MFWGMGSVQFKVVSTMPVKETTFHTKHVIGRKITYITSVSAPSCQTWHFGFITTKNYLL